MSKIGTIHMELEEQAAELGFESLEQATNAGCEINWLGNTAELVEPLELAHREWEKEKQKVLIEAKEIQKFFHEYDDRAPEFKGITSYADNIVKFIKEAHE